MLTSYIFAPLRGEYMDLYKVLIESRLMHNWVRRPTIGQVLPTAQPGFCRISHEGD
jgi:hypothetical protein